MNGFTSGAAHSLGLFPTSPHPGVRASETPDSKGKVRQRVRRSGFVANTKDITSIEVGIASAKNP